MRIVCFDMGTKRIGVAASDPLGLTSQPHSVIVRKGGKADLAEMAKIIRELDAERVIIGLPLDEEGFEGKRASLIKAFGLRLVEYMKSVGVNCPVEYWDERYSTAKADEHLIKQDVSRERRRRVIDKMAAAMILADYLEVRNYQSSAGQKEG
jgi:putative Holliday junction resolvase